VVRAQVVQAVRTSPAPAASSPNASGHRCLNYILAFHFDEAMHASLDACQTKLLHVCMECPCEMPDRLLIPSFIFPESRCISFSHAMHEEKLNRLRAQAKTRRLSQSITIGKQDSVKAAPLSTRQTKTRSSSPSVYVRHMAKTGFPRFTTRCIRSRVP
jgi:hypothetical protein